MKKLIIFIFTCISFLSYAQNYQLTNHDGVPYTDGETIAVTITEADLDDWGGYAVDVILQNQTDIELFVRTLRENIALPTGMFAYVCFGYCDDSGEEFAMDCMVGEQEAYELHLKPNGKTGLCKFKIDFSTPEQNMTLFINVDVVPVGVQEYNNAKTSLSAFPNPTTVNSKVNVSYTLADKSCSHCLVIRNIMGVELLSKPLNPNDSKISIETSSLLPGIYFYAIESKNQVFIAKKLIVK